MTTFAVLLDELKHGSPVQKQQAMYQLAAIRHQSIQQLLDAVTESDHQLIETILEAYDWEEGEGQKYDFHPLTNETMLNHASWYVAAISELLKNSDPAIVQAVMILLDHPKNVVRAWAAHQLGAIGNESAIPSLLFHLTSTNRAELYRVIEALGKLKAAEAVDPLIVFLQNDEVDGVASTALGRIGDGRAIEPLILLLKQHKPSVYATSAALYQFGKDAVEPLISVLFDEAAVRVHDLVLMKLWMLKDKRAVEPIIRLLATTQNPETQFNAVAALGYLEAKDAIDSIAHVFHTTSDPELQWSSAMALARIGSKKAFDILIAALNQGIPEMQHAAALAFGEMERVVDIQPILEGLKHDDDQIRSATAVSLGNLKDKRAIEALKAVLNDPDETTRQFAEAAIQKIASANLAGKNEA